MVAWLGFFRLCNEKPRDSKRAYQSYYHVLDSSFFQMASFGNQVASYCREQPDQRWYVCRHAELQIIVALDITDDNSLMLAVCIGTEHRRDRPLLADTGRSGCLSVWRYYLPDAKEFLLGALRTLTEFPAPCPGEVFYVLGDAVLYVNSESVAGT